VTCKAIKADGTRCKGPPRADGLCWAHSPELRAKAIDAKRQGGRARSNAARAKKQMSVDLQTIVKMVESSMAGVYKGTLTPPQGQALASLAGAWVRLHEHGELEARLRDLEARAGTGGKRWA
jgi:hypothetical protein